MKAVITRRNLLAAGLSAPFVLAATKGHALPSALLDAAIRNPQLRAIAIWSGGAEIAARGYRTYDPDQPTNIKSASKSVISALAGIAVSKGMLSGTDQTLASVLRDEMPAKPDPRLLTVTLGNLLSMQAGLAPQSGANYGQWVNSPDWVRKALAAPFADRPGGRMLYSTASTHLVSAMLTKLSGRSTLQLARDWLGAVPGFHITAWQRDPQGIYIGGNEMAMSTRSLMAFGALYAADGYAGGTEIVPLGWIRDSWKRRTASVYTGAGYGYGWFLGEMGGRVVNYGWGYGGQMIYVAPATRDRAPVAIAMTSDPELPSGANGYRERLHALAAELLATV